MLIVADERHRSDRGHRAVLARVRPPALRRFTASRNLLAKLPERERERVSGAYSQALDDATGERDADAQRDTCRRWSTRSIERATPPRRSISPDDLDALVVRLRYPTRHRRRWRSTTCSNDRSAKSKRRTKVIGRSPARPAASRSSRPSSTSTSATPANSIKLTQLERRRPQATELRRTRTRPSPRRSTAA